MHIIVILIQLLILILTLIPILMIGDDRLTVSLLHAGVRRVLTVFSFFFHEQRINPSEFAARMQALSPNARSIRGPHGAPHVARLLPAGPSPLRRQQLRGPVVLPAALRVALPLGALLRHADRLHGAPHAGHEARPVAARAGPLAEDVAGRGLVSGRGSVRVVGHLLRDSSRHSIDISRKVQSREAAVAAGQSLLLSL